MTDRAIDSYSTTPATPLPYGTTSLSATFTGVTSGSQYRIRNHADGTAASGQVTAGGTSVTISITVLPAAGSSITYRLQTLVSGSWLICDQGTFPGTFTVSQDALDTTPDGYNNFSSLFDQTPNTTVTSSSSYVVTGINAPASITVSGSGGSSHQYGINGAYSSSNSTVSSGQTVTARHTTGGYNTTATTTITIGGVGRTFTSTTIVPPTVSSVSLDTTTAVRYIGCTISVNPSGSGGSLEYAVSTSATYNTGIVFNWQASNTFSATASHLERGQTYYFWARRADASAAASSLSSLVSYILPPATITTTAPPSTIAYNAGSQTNTVTNAGQTSGPGVYYRLLKDGADNVGEFNPNTQNLPRAVDIATPTELPPPNTSSSYQWQCVRFLDAGGDGLYDNCTGTGSSFTITRENVPAPNTPTATPSTEGDANPSVTVSATGGVGVTYNITAGATTPSTGWGAGPFTATSDTSATLTRGQTYYIWARSNYTYNAVNYTNAVSTTYNVPYLDPQYPSAVFPTAVNVFFGATSFDIDIFNGETSTSDNTFQIRTGSYTGTIVGTGNAILNDTVTITVNDTVGVNLGDTETYYITAYRSVGTGGSGGVTVANVTTFTATTIITTPVVNDSQNLTSTEEDNIIDHTIAMTSLGGGGTLQYAISTSATYNVNIVRTWQSSPSFTGANGIERGTAYYFWARRADSATYADSAGPFTADFLLPYLGLTAETPPANIAFDATASYDFNVLTVNGGAAPPPGASPAVGHYYRLMRTTGSPDDQVGFYDPNTTPNKLITLSYPGELPPEGTTWNYQWQVRRFNGAGGPLTAVYYDCTGTGSSFSVTRASGDTIPDQFTFTDAGRVLKNTLITSTAITVTGISAAATIGVTGSGGTNHAYEINNSGNWLTTNSTVTNGATVKVRHTSSTSDNTAANTTLDIGGVTDTFTSTTYRMPQYGVGTVTVGSTLLDSNNTSNVTVSWTTPDSFAQYRIRRLDYDPVNNQFPTATTSAGTSAAGASSIVLNQSIGDLPSQAYTGQYRIQIRVPTGASGGNGTWYAARTPGSTDPIVEFFISRIKAPTVAPSQNFDLYTNSSTINHQVTLADGGAYGTLQVAVTSAAGPGLAVPGTPPSTWFSASNIFSLTRGNSYHFWARRTNNNNISSQPSQQVPAAIQDFGFLVYNSSSLLIMDSTSLIGRKLTYGELSHDGDPQTQVFTVTVTEPNRTSSNTAFTICSRTTYYGGTGSIPQPIQVSAAYSSTNVVFTITINCVEPETFIYYCFALG